MGWFDRVETDPERERKARADQRARVKLLELRMRRMVSSVLSGAYRSSFRGSGIEFDEVRPYQPGDEVRSIDWNVTARTGAPHVKTYQEERQLLVDLLVDVSASMHFGSRISKLDAAEQFTALISCAAELQRDPVGLNLFDDGPREHLPAHPGAAQTQRILVALEQARNSRPRAGNGAGFAAALDELRSVLGRRTLLFVVSDFRTDPEAWLDPLRRLAQAHDVIAVRVQDALERELPAELGLVRVQDPESGQLLELDAGSARVREWWQRAAEERDAELDRTLTRARVERIELETPRWDPARVTASDELVDVEPVIAFFRRRARGAGAKA